MLDLALCVKSFCVDFMQKDSATKIEAGDLFYRGLYRLLA